MWTEDGLKVTYEAYKMGYLAGACAGDALAEKDTEIAWLKAELERRTDERDYHMRIADRLADRIRAVTNGHSQSHSSGVENGD